MRPNEKDERELTLRCKIIFDMTKEIVEIKLMLIIVYFIGLIMRHGC